MNLEGTIVRVGEVKEVGEKKYQVREFVVVESTGDYPQGAKFQFFGEDKVNYVTTNESAKGFKVGDEVNVEFNLKATESKKEKGVWFTNLGAWKISKSDWEGGQDACEDCDLPF